METGRLRTPSSLPELASLDISPEYLDTTHFRNPPKIEIGADGIRRYRGEADDLDISPDSSAAIGGPVPVSTIPPLLTEGRVTEGSSRKPRRYDPYPQAGKSRTRHTRSPAQDGPNASGENASSPVASGSSTPLMTAQSPPTTTQQEPNAPMTVSAPQPMPHAPPYGMPAYYHIHPHMYGAAPPHLSQPPIAAPYPPQGPGTNSGTISRSSIAPTTASHVPLLGAVPPLHYAYPGYLPPVAHPNAGASTSLTTPTQVRVSDQSQAGLVPITSQQPGPAPVAAAPVPGHNGQVPYGHGPPQYHYPYYPVPHPAQFQQPPGYPPAPAPVAYQWSHYPAYTVPPPPPHPSARHQPQAVPVQTGAASYAQVAQPQQRGNVASTHAEEGDAEMEDAENE